MKRDWQIKKRTLYLIAAISVLTSCSNVVEYPRESQDMLIEKTENIQKPIRDNERRYPVNVEERYWKEDYWNGPYYDMEIGEMSDFGQAWGYDWYKSLYSSFSEKDEYMEEISRSIATVSLEKQESDTRQEEVDCETLQWLNATYSIFVASGNGDPNYIAGYRSSSENNKEYIQEQLLKNWGIYDKWSAIECLLWLADEGHALEYDEIMQFFYWYDFLECDEQELKEYLDMLGEYWYMDELEELFDILLDLREANEKCGKNGIDAWDYCRIMQLCGGLYLADYFTLEETLTVQLAVGQVIQKQFASWEEMADSYLYGHAFGAYDSLLLPSRQKACDELFEKGDSLFSTLDFNMTLEKFW